MNITQFLPGLRGEDVEPLSDEEVRQLDKEARRAAAPKHGPRPVRYMTNGQVRRAKARADKAQVRKANRRFRRQWLADQQAIANVKGMLAVTAPESRLTADHPLRINAERGLERNFGGEVDDNEQPIPARSVALGMLQVAQQAAGSKR